MDRALISRLIEHIYSVRTTGTGRSHDEPPYKSVKLIDIHRYERDSDFRNSTLVWITIDAPIFDRRHLPGSRSTGLFALTQDSLIHLHAGVPNACIQVIMNEPDWWNLAVEPLGQLICDGVLSSKRAQYSVITGYEDCKRTLGRKVVSRLSPTEVHSIESRIKAPVKFVGESGLLLRFSALQTAQATYPVMAQIEVSIVSDAPPAITQIDTVQLTCLPPTLRMGC